MDNSTLLRTATDLVRAMNKVADDSLPEEIAEIVKTHSAGAAIAGVAGGWVPGVGGTAAVVIAAGFVWTMYGRVNGKIELPFSENIIKSVGSGIATNLAAYAVGSIALSAAFSFFPGVGSVGASVIVGGTCYALTLASGIVYLKILTRVFQAGHDPTAMSAENLQEIAKTVIQSENMKEMMKEAKKEYKAAKERGDFDEEPEK